MEMVRPLLSVGLVMGLLVLAVWLLRRKTGGFGVSGKNRSLASAERLALTPQHALHLVRCNGRELLVATHPQGCSLLSDRADASQGAGA